MIPRAARAGNMSGVEFVVSALLWEPLHENCVRKELGVRAALEALREHKATPGPPAVFLSGFFHFSSSPIISRVYIPVGVFAYPALEN